MSIAQEVRSKWKGKRWRGRRLSEKINNQTKINFQEIFGPVMSIMPFKNLDEVVARANNTTYLLAIFLSLASFADLSHPISSLTPLPWLYNLFL
jgi:acyl-CoA reductase-like NAD-dependent aldehyde dehydrogenase